MSKPLKVYGGNVHGQWRGVIAAASKAEAVRRLNDNGLNSSTSYFRNFWGETGNGPELTQALTEPGTLFVRSYRGIEQNNPWERWKK